MTKVMNIYVFISMVHLRAQIKLPVWQGLCTGRKKNPEWGSAPFPPLSHLDSFPNESMETEFPHLKIGIQNKPAESQPLSIFIYSGFPSSIQDLLSSSALCYPRKDETSKQPPKTIYLLWMYNRTGTACGKKSVEKQQLSIQKAPHFCSLQVPQNQLEFFSFLFFFMPPHFAISSHGVFYSLRDSKWCSWSRHKGDYTVPNSLPNLHKLHFPGSLLFKFFLHQQWLSQKQAGTLNLLDQWSGLLTSIDLLSVLSWGNLSITQIYLCL